MIDYSIKGICPNGCHECCTNFLVVSEKEIQQIKEYIKVNNISISNPNSIFSGYIDRCPFVNREGSCSIYPVRPEICRYFFCNKANEYRPFNHIDKKVINMLKTFDDKAYLPEDTPNEKELNKIYQEKKKKAGYNDNV